MVDKVLDAVVFGLLYVAIGVALLGMVSIVAAVI